MGADYKKSHHSVIAGSVTGAMGANLTRYFCINTGPGNVAELQVRIAMPFNCVITNLYARSGVVPGAGETVDYTVYVNGIASILAVQIAGGVQLQAGPDADVIALVPGDEISMEIVTSLNANAATHVWSLELRT